MVDFIFKKGRKRPYIGQLSRYDDLGILIKETFKEIKSEINKELGDDVVVYVFGSHLWGYADENSDYDVRIEELKDNRSYDLKTLGRNITETIEKDVHIVIVREDRVSDNRILIP